MKKILYIQYRDDLSKDHEKACILNKVPKRYSQFVTINSILDEVRVSLKDLSHEYYCIILGGSGQYDLSQKPDPLLKGIKKTKPLLDYAFDNDFPMFGICMGFQIIGMLLGGKIESIPKYSENGVLEVELKPNFKKDPVLRGIPSSFFVMQAHKDSLVSIPNNHNFKVVGHNDLGLTEIFKYKNNIYATSFHPELEKADIIYRWGLYPEYLKDKSDLEIKQMQNEIKPTPYATKILKNFIDYYSKLKS